MKSSVAVLEKINKLHRSDGRGPSSLSPTTTWSFDFTHCSHIGFYTQCGRRYPAKSSHIGFYAQCGLKLEVPKIMPNWFLSLRGKKPRAIEHEHRFLSTSTKYEDTCVHVFFCNPG